VSGRELGLGGVCSGACVLVRLSVKSDEGMEFTPLVGAAWVVIILIFKPRFKCAQGLQRVSNESKFIVNANTRCLS